MGIVSRNLLKGWFKTFAKPLEAQFHDWIDSFRHKDEKIGSGDLDAVLLQTINDLPNSAAVQQILTELQQKATIQQLQALQQQVDGLAVGAQPVTIPLVADDTYTIPAGRLMHKIVVVAGNDADADFAVGYSGATYELVEATTVPAGTAAVFAVDHFQPNDYPIFFHGISAPLTVIIYLL